MSAWNLERRRRPRVPLRWSAGIRRPGQSELFVATTVNVSCGGLYCIVSECFHPGEPLEVYLALPDELDQQHRALRLRCLASVLRLDSVEGGYGMACAIRDYDLIAVAEGKPESSSRLVQASGRD